MPDLAFTVILRTRDESPEAIERFRHEIDRHLSQVFRNLLVDVEAPDVGE